MNVGIIVYSQTGNTLAVAEQIKEELSGKGHTVSLERVTTVSEKPQQGGNVELKTVPDISTYDAVIFGAPVWAFSLCPVMKAYFAQISSLEGKKAGCFVTQQFPYAWMGGNRAVRQMKKACLKKGSTVFAAGIVNWGHKERASRINKIAEEMCCL